MINLSVTPNLDQAPWSDVAAKCPQIGAIERIGRLPHGTESGKSVVAVLVTLPDGKQFLAQTTLALFDAAHRALTAREAEESGANSRN